VDHPLAEADRIKVRDDHYCFGGGRLNPIGLKLTFYRSADGVLAPFTPEQRHEGYTGVVHGGIVTTVLDEVMAWALYAEEIWAVTGDLRVRFRRPVSVGVPTIASGRIVATRSRTVEVAASLIEAASDRVLADAAGTFVRVPEEQAEAWRARYLLDVGRTEDW
jgi:uncharacterized protein (TIGR00369 family)